MPEKPNCALAIDPGTAKCGIAVVRRHGSELRVLHQEVILSGGAENAVRELTQRYSPDAIVVGNGTTSGKYLSMTRNLGAAPVSIVDEKFSTLAARKLYFEENPPRGIRRLIPTSLQTPSRPYDDYVAVILAKSFMAEEAH
jgi:RNase H-fold protein (predicted Holliday junction resolvase)